MVVVIGAGAAGMATAARLAVKGHHVTVIEAANVPGGKLARYERDGYAFDTGPSLFTLPAVYRDLFLKTGGAFEEAVDLQEIDPAFAYFFADGSRVTVPGVGTARCANAFADSFGAQAGQDWRSLMERAGSMWRITRGPFLQSPLPDTRTLLRLARRPLDVRTIAPFTSLRALGRKHLRDPRMRLILDRYATYAGSDPRRAPAVLATIPYIEQTFGAWHLGGGVSELATALHDRCLERGVEFRFSTRVDRILTDAQGARGVLLDDGTRIDASIVVANADADTVYSCLVDDPRAAEEQHKLERADRSLAGFVMLLAVRGRTEGLAHHNVWFPADYDSEFDDIFGSNARPARDPAIYACVPDDPRMRPDGEHESWFILVNAPRHSTTPQKGAIDWCAPGVAEGYADHVLGLLAARGMDIRDRIEWRELRTPADLESATLSPGGAIYGSSSNGSRAAFARPANASPIPGLYLVGGSAHPGGGLPLVGMGAETTAELIGRVRD